MGSRVSLSTSRTSTAALASSNDPASVIYTSLSDFRECQTGTPLEVDIV